MNSAPSGETPYRREPGYGARYRDQRFRHGSGPGTHLRETKALRRLLDGLPDTPGPWLDLACGAGRFSSDLPSETVVQVDRHQEMLFAAGSEHSRVIARATALPFADKVFTGALCMRLLQHIPSAQERQSILSELTRVTRGPIILSFFHAISLQHLRRIIRRALGKTRSGRCAITMSQMRSDLASAGLRIDGHAPLRRGISEQHLLRVIAVDS